MGGVSSRSSKCEIRSLSPFPLQAESVWGLKIDQATDWGVEARILDPIPLTGLSKPPKNPKGG